MDDNMFDMIFGGFWIGFWIEYNDKPVGDKKQMKNLWNVVSRGTCPLGIGFKNYWKKTYIVIFYILYNYILFVLYMELI